MEITDKIASTHLGKNSGLSESYNPDLLVAVPRIDNRLRYGIKNLPFTGFDVWHAFEFSVMSENSIPVTRLLKIKYPVESEFIVESKSLKLYLNSFNMMKYGKNSNECLEICKKIIQHDLSEKLETKVEVEFPKEKFEQIFANFKNIMNFVDENFLKIEKFKEAPELLEVENSTKQSYYLHFDSLRSNCRVTHQPDFGDIFIYYNSKKHIKEESLIKYLISFRREYHFHEECCEMVYKRLFDILDKGDELFVCALYTRRGGIDICPLRTNCKTDVAEKLLDMEKYAKYGVR